MRLAMLRYPANLEFPDRYAPVRAVYMRIYSGAGFKLQFVGVFV
jgi:hypothetical protein